MNQLIGLKKTKYNNSNQRGQKYWSSGLTNTELSAERTVVTCEANQVAVIDRIDLHYPGSDSDPDGAGGGADAPVNNTITVTIGTMTMTFVARTMANRTQQEHYILRPKDTMWVGPGQSLKIVCSASSYAGNAHVRYRLMTLTDAAAKGIVTSEFWCCTTGSIAVAGTAQSITGFAAADVGSTRYLEINGIAITGTMTSATSASNLEILLEFTDGSSTHRKIIKGCYSSSDPNRTRPTIINNCVIRGPAGYGLRVTAGQTGTGARISLWGKYGVAPVGGFTTGVAPETWPGTGVAPGASDAFDAKKYFWIYYETVANGGAEIFPATTCANNEEAIVIDGYAFSSSAAGGSGAVLAVASAIDAQSLTPLLPTPVGGTGFGSAATYVDDEAEIMVRIKDRPTVSCVNLLGTLSKLSMLVWGRCTGGGESLSSGHRASRFGGGS